MANRIKGITVEIGGDTTGLDKALKGVNSTIKSTQSQLRDVNRLFPPMQSYLLKNSSYYKRKSLKPVKS